MFEIDCDHVLEQFMARYRKFEDTAHEDISRIMETLERHTPRDWRFTESASSRFFIIDERTHAKLMGMSYRDAGRELVRRIQNDVRNRGNTRDILARLDTLVAEYRRGIENHDLPIVHHIRTVYGKSDAWLKEEKRIFEETADALDHIIPLASKKIASRPNAAICANGELWVRQHMSWISMQQGVKEYYLFQPLSRDGIDTRRYAVFSHTEDGKFRQEENKQIDCPGECKNLEAIKPECFKEHCIRSDSYWKVPTYLDRRLSDLKFLKDQSEKAGSSSSNGGRSPKKGASGRHLADSEELTSWQLAELYVLETIVNKTSEKLGRPKGRHPR